MAKSRKIQLNESLKLYERACKVMPGGVNASARPNQAVGHPLFMERGEGAYLYDVDRNKHIDYCVSHGASLLGHGNPQIIAAVEKTMKRGGMLSSETEIQVRVAEQLINLFPGTDMVRYTCSGTESTWHALRVARAFTGKWGVIKFEGHYHGVNDTAGYSHWPELDKAGPADKPQPVPDSAGIPPANNALITILPFNDVAALERCMQTKGDDIAALIMEPINYDSCGLRPTPEFLQAVRDLTAKNGIILIFDEVLSGFRVRAGGALDNQVTPDMTVLGKAVGGGMPISTFMGTQEIMETCTPVGPALHSGTYNAPPVLVSAMGAFLDQVSKPGFYDHLNAMGDRLYGGINEVFARRGLKAWVQGVGCRFGILFGLDTEPRNYRDVSRQDMDMLGKFLLACLHRGVYLHHVSPHHGYSSAHTMADIEETLDVMDQAAAEIGIGIEPYMDINGIQEQFDFVAREYDAQRKKFIPCFDDYYTTMTDFLCWAVENPKSILGLGAGTGLLTKLLYDRFPDSTYTLIDISSDMLKIARKRFTGCANVNYSVVDYTKALPGGEYDLVTSALSIHHLSDDDKKALYSNIYRILPDNGWFANFDQFIAATPEMNELYNSWWYDSIRRSGLPPEEHDKWMVRKELDKENTINDTVTMLENTGFKLVECVYSFMKFGVIVAKKT